MPFPSISNSLLRLPLQLPLSPLFLFSPTASTAGFYSQIYIVMASLKKELVFLILQFLNEQKYEKTARLLEEESGLFFNMKHLEDIVLNEELEKAEKYLSGFTNIDDNQFSKKIFFEIRKMHYLETLDRAVMLASIKKLIEENPTFHDKLEFPVVTKSRLQILINQSLNWQHHLCNNRKPKPQIKTLFADHTCKQQDDAQASSSTISKPPIFTASPRPQSDLPFEWMANNPFSVPHQYTSGGPITLNSPTINYQTADFESTLKRLTQQFAIPQKSENERLQVDNYTASILPTTTYPPQNQAKYSFNDIPTIVVANMNQGTTVKSMDFHPLHQTMILVGTNNGDVAIWEVSTTERIALRNFKLWDIAACSMALQVSLFHEYTASVNRVIWNFDGTRFGVAYSKNIVHLYSYSSNNEVQNHLEIEAHVGNVNDLAFSSASQQLLVITCGEDNMIKVWDILSGVKLYTFEGHKSPVHSICPYEKNGFLFILSTDVDGKIKLWVHGAMNSIANYDAPGYACTRMTYSADGKRLFSCGTNKYGKSHLAEWNDKKRIVKYYYLGLGKKSDEIVQFDTATNQILAVGDQSVIKFWYMDNKNQATSIVADGGLSAFPCIRFNKGGTLLAVTTSDNGFKILANVEGVSLIRAIEHKRPKKSRSLDDAAVKVSAEEYEYEIFRSPEEYQKANLEPPRYDLPEKYTP
nr:topless-related protein 4 isoform X3 [Ipomoea trifida]